MCWIRWVQRNTCYATHVESGVRVMCYHICSFVLGVHVLLTQTRTRYYLSTFCSHMCSSVGVFLVLLTGENYGRQQDKINESTYSVDEVVMKNSQEVAERCKVCSVAAGSRSNC